MYNSKKGQYKSIDSIHGTQASDMAAYDELPRAVRQTLQDGSANYSALRILQTLKNGLTVSEYLRRFLKTERVVKRETIRSLENGTYGLE